MRKRRATAAAAAVAVAMAIGAVTLTARGQDSAQVPEARRSAPDPTAVQTAGQEELSRITDATSEAIRRERARRVAPLDLTWGTR